jgi:formate/nitrite transporter FocA (FNT family)
MEKSQLGLQKQSSKVMVFYKGIRCAPFVCLGFSLGHARWTTWPYTLVFYKGIRCAPFVCLGFSLGHTRWTSWPYTLVFYQGIR